MLLANNWSNQFTKSRDLLPALPFYSRVLFPWQQEFWPLSQFCEVLKWNVGNSSQQQHVVMCVTLLEKYNINEFYKILHPRKFHRTTNFSTTLTVCLLSTLRDCTILILNHPPHHPLSILTNVHIVIKWTP